ncbi:MAG: ABC transporter permease subunit [Solirubrobacteraceae bacterium]
MSALLRAELLKLRTTRTTWVLLAVALAIVVGALIIILALLDRGGKVTDSDLGDLFSLTAIADLLILSLGIVAAAGEFRHGTITAGFLITPSRWPVVLAKAIAYALVGLAYAAATLLVVLVVALPWLAAKDVSLELGGTAWIGPVAGRLLYAALTAALGVGLGTLFRNQAAALVTALVTLLAIEPALSAVSDAVATYGLNGASTALFGASESFGGDGLPFWGGALLYAGYAALFVGAGVALTMRRDVA